MIMVASPSAMLFAVLPVQIPTKIEVFVGFSNGSAAGADAAAAAAAGSGSMRRLGYLSFDSNERSNHQARELKSVHVTVEAELVRLVIHRCHVNKLNIYNQVRHRRPVRLSYNHVHSAVHRAPATFSGWAMERSRTTHSGD
jgi:hypothetical protein